MREIKFRAWWVNKQYLPNGMMFRVGGLSFAIPQEEEPESDYQNKVVKVGLMRYDSDKIGWNDASECTLMQYTGLKDKNGKEIYEGDVVRDFLEKPAVVMFGDYSAGGLDYYASAAYGFYVQRYFNGKLQEGDTETLYRHEIIGNIYENSELINNHA